MSTVPKFDTAAINRLQKILTNSELPMSQRNRAAFTLKAINNNEAIDALRHATTDPSVLLAHEVCYIMGQMQNPYAVPCLVDTLNNDKLHPMVRHEAAEALGNIGGEEAITALTTHKDHPLPEIADTCKIALDLLKWKNENKDSDALEAHPVFMSVDPAPAKETKNVEVLRKNLLDKNASLFDRYRALFTLRNVATQEAIAALCEALLDQESGAVFTHEVAYVLGQIQDKSATKALIKALEDESLNCMVRHEAAEALGSIADDEIKATLEKFKEDKVEPVSQSCVVALDILDYFNSDEFQYANNGEGIDI